MAVAVGFSAYFNDLLDNVFGFHLPAQAGPIRRLPAAQFTGAWFNVPALVILLVLTWILVRGVRESAEHQQRDGGDQDRGHPDLRDRRGAGREHRQLASVSAQRISGVLTGAAIVFFTYIGFDSVSTAAEECRHPQRDLPFGIIATLVICAIFYISVALVLTGIARWKTL